MIIKTAKGDWAILVGYWEGLKRGTPGSLCKFMSLSVLNYKKCSHTCLCIVVKIFHIVEAYPGNKFESDIVKKFLMDHNMYSCVPEAKYCIS